MGRVLRQRRPHPWPGPGQVRDAAPARAGPGAAGRRARPAQHRLHQHDPARARALVPRRRVRRAAHPRLYPLERRRHGVPGQPAGPRRRRPHRDLRLGRQPVRGRLQPLLPRQGPRRVRRPGLLPGSRRARHLRPRLPGGPADRAAARRLPAGTVPPGRGPAVVPASAADAGLLGVPHRLHGPRRHQRHLPGPLQPVPAGPRDARTPAGRTSGRSSATARPTSRRYSARSAWPPARSWTTSPS